MTVKIREVDYSSDSDGKTLLHLLDSYARDPMGGGEALSDYALNNLQEKLAGFPGAFSLLAFVNEQPAGFSNCFTGFSTFNCQPLVNIHDIAVQPEFRNAGIARALIGEIVNIARARQCCKITLEVLHRNAPAKAAYRKAGFSEAGLDPALGGYEFWHMPLEVIENAP